MFVACALTLLLFVLGYYAKSLHEATPLLKIKIHALHLKAICDHFPSRYASLQRQKTRKDGLPPQADAKDSN